MAQYRLYCIGASGNSYKVALYSMFRRSGYRFADKNMRNARVYGRFRPKRLSGAIQFDRKWL
jgi:hypothetical protein